jgi:acyl-CoA dehydrogenase
MREKARAAGVLTPHILPDGGHLSQVETAYVLQKSGLSPLGPLAVNTMASDEGNMCLLGRIGSPVLKKRFLDPLVAGTARSAFFMTEPASEGGAGSVPSMMKTTCRLDGNHWVIDRRSAFITGAQGAQVGIIMAMGQAGACMFLMDLPDPAIRIEHVPNTIDSSMPGGHATVHIENLRVPADQMLGKPGEGFKYAQPPRASTALALHALAWLLHQGARDCHRLRQPPRSIRQGHHRS